MNRRDLGRFLIWFLLQGLIIAAIMALLTALGTLSSFKLPWSLIAVAALLAVVYQRGHYLLVLGLGSAALAAQYAPAFFGYALILTLPLYALLRWRNHHRTSEPSRWNTLAYWGLLGLGFLVLPWLLRIVWGERPASWLWWHGFAAASVFVLYARLWFASDCTLIRKGYFEHLGYVLFPAHRIALIPVSPSWLGPHSRASIRLNSYRHAWKAVALAAVKVLFFLILTRLHSAPAHPEDVGFTAAWWYLLLHYICWLCWIQAHFDLAVALSRMLGLRLPIIYDRPLLALSLTRWWHRFNHLIPHLARKSCPHLPEQSGLRAGLVVALSYLLIPIGMIGSVFTVANPVSFLNCLIFVALIAVGIGIEISLGNRLFHPTGFRGWQIIPRWLLTHGTLALAHLFLINNGYFYGDPLWLGNERWAFFLSLLPG